MSGLRTQLNLSIGAYTAQQQEDMYFRRLEHAVREGFWPFQPREVRISSGFDLDYNKYALYVDVFFQDIVFPVSLSIPSGVMSIDPDQTIHALGQELKKKYRKRPIVSRDQHKLGEE